MANLICRSCAKPLSTVFVDLGLTPISNAFVQPKDDERAEKFYPLRAFVCDACHLVQLQDFKRPESHFHDHYAYFSSYSETWLAHAHSYSQAVVERYGLGPQSRIVEVASNDGYLLQYFLARGIPSLGIDPARNCAEEAWRKYGVETEVAFFGRDTARRLKARGFTADLMVANNVLAHVPDLNDFLAGFAELLKPNGVATFEFPHLLELIRNNQFDTIYHEHYSYLSLLALMPLFSRHDLAVVDVEHLPTHGGSLRLHVCPAAQGVEPGAALAACLAMERAARLHEPDAYRDFADRVRTTKRALLGLLINLKNKGARIAGYGAPAKGNTLLTTCGIGTDFIDFTVDRNEHKQGLLLPGSRIQIRAPEAIFVEKPDYVFILPWNLKDEIVEQMAGIRDWGGRFILAIPSVRVL
jgi:SAM-dependent methyltransferase